MSVNRIVLIRPGETEWNKLGRWQGTVAVPLNAHGILQAKRLAKFVRNIGLDAIYSSDLRRAKETAAIISEYTNVPLQYDKRLRERSMGGWQGLTINEIQDWYRVEYKELLADPHHIRVPNGESRLEVATRVLECFHEIINREGNTVGIISHTTAIRTLLAELIPDSAPYNMYFHNMSVTTIVRNDDSIWKITQLDDVSHLEGMASAYIGGIEGNIT